VRRWSWSAEEALELGRALPFTWLKLVTTTTLVHFQFIFILGYKKIAIVARRRPLLEETAEKMRPFMGPSGKILILTNDLGTEEGCKASVEDTVTEFGGMNCSFMV